MGEWLRWAVATPAYIAFAVWEWLTHDEFEDFIAEQRQRFIDLAKGE